MADLYSKIIFEDLTLPTHLHADAADLLRQLLNRTAGDRPSLDSILEHPWLAVRKVFSKDFDELEWEVEYNLARSEALGSIITSVLVGRSQQASDAAMQLFDVRTEDHIREQIELNQLSKLKP